MTRTWKIDGYKCPTGFASVTIRWNAGGRGMAGRWQFSVGGNSGATGFGWTLDIRAEPGSDFEAAIRSAVAGEMPPDVLADRMEDESDRYRVPAAWLREPELKAA